jgi:hypothetical protein
MPKILLFDLETSPAFGTFWPSNIWKANVLKVHQDWFILMAGYKWLGDKTTKIVSMYDYDLFDKDPTDDYAVCEVMHNLFDEADVVIAHNGDKFDIPRLNARMIQQGFSPPSPAKTIDTLKIAKNKFAFTQNSLGELGQALGLGKKLSTGGYQLWEDCMDGCPKAWNKMSKYCKQDVDLLEKVYLTLRPWDDRHPNLAVFEGGFQCPTCNSKDIQQRGYRTTNTCTYKQFMCKSCGRFSRKRLSEKTKPKPELR